MSKIKYKCCPMCRRPFHARAVKPAATGQFTLTAKQQELKNFIVKYVKKNDGVAPTFAEMLVAVDLHSKAGIFRLLNGLEERGHIRRPTNRARAIEIVSAA